MALGQANYPASFNQESVLLGWELMIRAKRRLPLPQGPIAFETESAPSLSVLKATLRALLRRHAALRTRFQLRNGATISDLDRVLAMFGRTRLFVSGMFEQVIEDEEECSEIPLKVFPQRADLERWVDEPLDYRCSPACSAAVAYEGTKAFFALVVSHLVVDGWSVRIIQRDLIDLYAAIIGGHAPSGANHAGCHPGEFAAWQHRMVAQGGFAADEAFWLESWRAAAPAEVPLELLPCRRRDECNGDWTESVTVTVDEEASRLVRRAAARSRVTPYAIFRSALAIVLHAYSGRQRVAFWLNLANRSSLGCENAVGWLANSHAVAVDVPPMLPVKDLWASVRQGLAAAVDHQALPLAAVWRAMGRHPHTCDTRVNFDWWYRPPALSRVDLTSCGIRGGRQWMDLDVRVREKDDGLALVGTFKARRYEPEGVERLVKSVIDVALHSCSNEFSTVRACAAQAT